MDGPDASPSSPQLLQPNGAAREFSRRRFLGRSLLAGIAGVLLHFLPGPHSEPVRHAEAACSLAPTCFLVGTVAHCTHCSGTCGIRISYYIACLNYTPNGGIHWTYFWWVCCCWGGQCGPCDGRSLGGGYRC